MNNQTDQDVFRVIDKPEVKETIVECDLRLCGENFTAKLRRRSNFSDGFVSARTRFDKIAEKHTHDFGVGVSEITVRLADRIARMWEHPMKPDGSKVNRDDLVKLSIENDKAFAALVNCIDGDDIDAAEDTASADFPKGANSTPDTLSP